MIFDTLRITQVKKIKPRTLTSSMCPRFLVFYSTFFASVDNFYCLLFD